MVMKMEVHNSSEICRWSDETAFRQIPMWHFLAAYNTNTSTAEIQRIICTFYFMHLGAVCTTDL